MLKMLWPVGLVVFANCFYNICTKSTPEGANAFLSLAVTYAVGMIFSLAIFAFGGNGGFVAEIKSLNWTSIVLGFVIVGLEVGYIFIYRAGWKVSAASLTANIVLACVLIFVGALLYKETITVKQLVGIAVCGLGLVIMNR